MIRVRITVDSRGNLRSLKAEGHSMTALKGDNIVCAAVSAQLRSVVRVLGTSNSAGTVIKADRPGFLELIVKENHGPEGWLNGVTEVLLAGLLETGNEYPGECSVELIRND